MLPLLGSLSDKADTRWGKRTPFIVVGTVLAVVLMMLLPHADKTGNFVLFVIACFPADCDGIVPVACSSADA
ncbi:MAG: MFS transporter [Gallintestinimicrobium sp.]